MSSPTPEESGRPESRLPSSPDSNRPSTSGAKADEGLPKWEPLTPAHVEEDAQRGDFAMRWAVVVLALLMASRVVAETRTLMHVKSGQMLATRGFLPPALDQFSATAGDHPWTNLTWLFDLLVSGLYAVGGWAGLSVLMVIIASVTFGLIVHINRRNTPTWWGSVCAAIAVLACLPRLTVQPELITLCGLAITLWAIESTRQNGPAWRLWMLIPIFMLWSNLDDRMFVGLLVLVLYAAGESLGALIGRAGLEESAERRKHLWLTVAGSLIAATVHPFTWKWLTAPQMLYGVLYPEMRIYTGNLLASSPPGTPPGQYVQYFPIFSGPFGAQIDVTALAGLVLIVLALVCLVLNARRIDVGHLLMFFGVTALALLTTHELAAAALTCAVLATLNGQAWYAATFRGDYSVESLPLLFSRGGRAATVVGLFAIALLAILGRIQAPGGALMGFGIDPGLAGGIAGYQKLVAGQEKRTFFHLAPHQGDLLIWVGSKSFVDQRIIPFAGSGDASLLALHRKVAAALRARRVTIPGSGDTKVWKDTLDRYKITAILPPLSGRNHDYEVTAELLNSPDWQLAAVSSSAALFERVDALPVGERRKLALERRQAFRNQAFRGTLNPVPPHAGWTQLPMFHERYLWKEPNRTRPDVREAGNLMFLANMRFAQMSSSRRLVDPRELPFDLVYLAIRKLQTAISQSDQDAGHAYALLAESYSFLARLESLVLGQTQPTELFQMRYFQVVTAYQQSLIANPDNMTVRQALFGAYFSSQKWDLALRELQAFDQLLAAVPNPTEEEKKTLVANTTNLKKIQAGIEQLSGPINLARGQNLPAQQIAVLCVQRGLPLTGLRALESDSNVQVGNIPPDIRYLKIMLMLECGQTQEAYEEAGRLEVAARQIGSEDWKSPRALTMLMNGEFDAAGSLWADQGEQTQRLGFLRLLITTPPRPANPGAGPWPARVLNAAMEQFYNNPQQFTLPTLQAALTHLEGGDLKRATEEFQAILKSSPETPFRPVIAFYLYYLTGEEVDFLPPLENIPILFAEEENPS